MQSEILYHWSDSFALVYTTVISLFGLVLNILLLYVMMKNTPKEMEIYSIVIRIGVVCDIFSSIATSLATTRFGAYATQPQRIPQVSTQIFRIFMTDGSLFFMFNGLCTLLFPITHDRLTSSQVCFYLYYSELHFFIFSQFILIYSYIYRYRVIRMPFDQFKKLRVRFVCYSFTIIFICYYNYTFYMAISPQDQIDGVVAAARPELIGSPVLYNGIVNHDHPVHIFVSFVTLSTTIVVLVVAAYCSFQVNRILRRTQTSTQNPLLHKSLLNVLRAQTLNPLVAIIAVILFIACNRFPDLRTPIVENLILLPVVTITVITPVVTIAFIQPYKIAVGRIFGFYKSSNQSLRSISENAGRTVQYY